MTGNPGGKDMKTGALKQAAAAAGVAVAGAISASGADTFVQAPLPYADNALEPYLSAKTFSFHYGKHHKAYVDNANKMVAGTALAGKDPVEIIKSVAGKPDQAGLFNNAAQAWNHAFFWSCMKPQGGGEPAGALADAIVASFGSVDAFKKAFAEAAMTQFGSGWAWLVKDGAALKVVKTPNADTPLAHGQTPLLTVDVWEHAYYLDYQNRRKDFVDAFLANLVNWDFVAKQFGAAK